MTQNATAMAYAAHAEGLAARDSSHAQPEFVLADVSRDDAGLAMPVSEARSLRDWV